MQRFDSALRLNVHAHTLVLDGGYVWEDEKLVFRKLGGDDAESVTEEDVEWVGARAWQRIEVILRKHGRDIDDVDPVAEQEPFLAEVYGHAISGRGTTKVLDEVDETSGTGKALVAQVGGINVHAERLIDGRDRPQLERLCRYAMRPPIAQKRLELLPDGRVYYEMKRPWKDGTVSLVFEPLGFIRRLCAFVPPPYFHMVRYFGVLAPTDPIQHRCQPNPFRASSTPTSSCGCQCYLSIMAMSWTLAPVEPEHAEAMHRIVAHPEVAPRVGMSTTISVASVRSQLNKMTLARTSLVGAWRGPKLLGVAEMSGLAHARRRHDASVWVAVHPEHQAKGVGKALLAAMTRAADMYWGYVRLSTTAQHDDKRAIKFCQLFGFDVEIVAKSAWLVQGQYTDAAVLARLRPGFVPPDTTWLKPIALPSAQIVREKIRIRTTEPEDAPHIASIMAGDTAIEGTMQLPFPSSRVWDEILRSNPTSVHPIVASYHDELIGTAALLGHDSPVTRHSASFGIAVKEGFQGRGVGDLMLTHLLRIADNELGLSRVELEVNEDNEHAIRLYARHGFVKEGLRRLESYRRGGYSNGFGMARLSGGPSHQSFSSQR